jgi:hypothetical protein
MFRKGHLPPNHLIAAYPDIASANSSSDPTVLVSEVIDKHVARNYAEINERVSAEALKYEEALRSNALNGLMQFLLASRNVKSRQSSVRYDNEDIILHYQYL